MRHEFRRKYVWGVTAAAFAALVLPLGAAAKPAEGKPRGAFVPSALVAAAESDPGHVFDVIVQGEGPGRAGDAVGAVRAEHPGKGAGVERRFATIAGVSAELTGAQLLKLARKNGILAITPDSEMRSTAYDVRYTRSWQDVAGVPKATGSRVPATIAIVDSGVDASHPALAGRVLEQVTLTSLGPNSPGDGRGHGTLVASIAAGASGDYPGVAPSGKIVSLDVLNDLGEGRVSDVIAAADWILQNKERHGIRIANFSLHAAAPSSFLYDPLDKAVERLWFGGVVVVAAAGNYGVDGQATRVLHAPANDPFVITVGALDIAGSKIDGDDLAASWSAFGYTLDGFAKPEVVAPGRYMVGAVPAGAALPLARPERLVAPGYMWMSGTSFAAPVVAGAAAWVLTNHPGFTPDQVKGALMAGAQKTANRAAAPLSVGVGVVRATSSWNFDDPPNPNAGLNRFLLADPAGGPLPVFDAASWSSAAQADASWDSASWSSASWSDASWTSASWSSASWSSASWSDASWTSASWSSASWTSAAWAASLWVE